MNKDNEEVQVESSDAIQEQVINTWSIGTCEIRKSRWKRSIISLKVNGTIRRDGTERRGVVAG
jgi:hypothetical protein